MEMGAGLPEAFASMSRMHRAARPRRGRSWVLASTQGSLKFMDVAATSRSFLGSCGGAARQDILIKDAAHGLLESDAGSEARTT